MAMRVIYGFLITSGFVMMSVGEGLAKTVLSSLALVFLATGLYLFIRYEMTTYTYIAMENDNRIDFYVDREVGKRGGYVCYFPLSDCRELSPLTKGKKSEIRAKYGKSFFYNYCHNRIGVKKHIIVFENDGFHDCIICQLDEKALSYLERAIELSKQAQ